MEGTKYAAGLTLKEENYLNFKNKFETVVKKQIDPKLLTPEIEIDTELNFTEIDGKFYRILKQFAPFGPKNRAPVFLTTQVYDTGFAKTVGADNSHLKCCFQQKNSTLKFNAIGFGLGNKLSLLTEKKTVKIVYAIDENVWNNQVSLQLRIKDILPE